MKKSKKSSNYGKCKNCGGNKLIIVYGGDYTCKKCNYKGNIEEWESE